MAMDSNGDEVYTGSADQGDPELADPLPAGEPSASSFMNEFGDLVSDERPVDSPSGSRKLGNLRRASYTAR